MVNNSKIEVLIVDDHPVVRSGLQFALSQANDLTIVGEAESGEEAIYLAKKLSPDVIVMDIQMDGLSGVETSEIILRKMPQMKIVGLSSFGNANVSTKLLKIGAKAFLLKDTSADDIIDTIRKVNLGKVLKPKTNTEISNNPNQLPTSEFNKLGMQQLKVLSLMTKGFTNPEIAEKMNLSVSTARYHVSAILNKLDVSNRSEAVAVAIRDDLINENSFG